MYIILLYRNYSMNLKIYLYRSHKIFIANLYLVKIQYAGWKPS